MSHPVLPPGEIEFRARREAEREATAAEAAAYAAEQERLAAEARELRRVQLMAEKTEMLRKKTIENSKIQEEEDTKRETLAAERAAIRAANARAEEVLREQAAAEANAVAREQAVADAEEEAKRLEKLAMSMKKRVTGALDEKLNQRIHNPAAQAIPTAPAYSPASAQYVHIGLLRSITHFLLPTSIFISGQLRTSILVGGFAEVPAEALRK